MNVCCVACGDIADTLDHIVPMVRGGQDIASNIMRLCRRCNSSKGSKTPSEWRGDLPGWVYEAERALGSQLEKHFRSRREKLTPKVRTVGDVEMEWLALQPRPITQEVHVRGMFARSGWVLIGPGTVEKADAPA
jgi:hypothetical protein